ncbi:hypothetical protein E4K10_48080 [Streptomyces sp. T1317-0309]|nr:hypothetical protein E4K10_48080 [Streptomyces sp. T1317-0309]
MRTSDTAVTLSPSRHVVVTPGMCSGGSLLFGRIGDWTWDAVADACGMNVHAARTPAGKPAYLAFYYFHVRGGRTVHPHGLTFGDELRVTSRVFRLGGSSVITLHRLAPADLSSPTPSSTPPRCTRTRTGLPLRPELQPLGRQDGDGQHGPRPGAAHRFDDADLPRLPNRYSPRALVGAAARPAPSTRRAPWLHRGRRSHTVEYTLDVVRDLNGAGLMYLRPTSPSSTRRCCACGTRWAAPTPSSCAAG